MFFKVFPLKNMIKTVKIKRIEFYSKGDMT